MKQNDRNGQNCLNCLSKAHRKNVRTKICTVHNNLLLKNSIFMLVAENVITLGGKCEKSCAGYKFKHKFQNEWEHLIDLEELA